ncbi:MAG: hypothetical protein U0Y68_17460 [Blastocatellia bacterium]
MSKNDNPLVKLIRLALVAGGSLFLLAMLWSLGQRVPDARYLLLFSLAMLLAWPRLQLPINSTEVLFFSFY